MKSVIKFSIVASIALCGTLLGASCKKNNKVAPKDLPEQPAPVVDTTQTNPLSKIVINLNGMKNSSGSISVALYNSSSSFNDPNNAFKKFSVNAQSGSQTITIDDVPEGTYAIGLIHDENNNNQIDKNVLGIPKEGFAFSNNAMGSFGPPSYDQSKFNVPAKSVVTQILSLNFY